jgi:hypothetical protein
MQTGGPGDTKSLWIPGRQLTERIDSNDPTSVIGQNQLLPARCAVGDDGLANIAGQWKYRISETGANVGACSEVLLDYQRADRVGRLIGVNLIGTGPSGTASTDLVFNSTNWIPNLARVANFRVYNEDLCGDTVSANVRPVAKARAGSSCGRISRARTADHGPL